VCVFPGELKQNLHLKRIFYLKFHDNPERNFVRKFGHLFLASGQVVLLLCLENNFSQDLWTINAKSFWG